MLWQGQELTEESLIMYDLDHTRAPAMIINPNRVVRAGDVDIGDRDRRTHLEFLMQNPDTILYRWPTLFEIMEYKNGQVHPS